jgi:hypothetical protein
MHVWRCVSENAAVHPKRSSELVRGCYATSALLCQLHAISTPAGLLEDEENCWVSMESITSDSVKVHDYLCPVKSARVW